VIITNSCLQLRPQQTLKSLLWYSPIEIALTARSRYRWLYPDRQARGRCCSRDALLAHRRLDRAYSTLIARKPRATIPTPDAQANEQELREPLRPVLARGSWGMCALCSPWRTPVPVTSLLIPVPVASLLIYLYLAGHQQGLDQKEEQHCNTCDHVYKPVGCQRVSTERKDC
jgi:hypothetical protein